MIQRAMVRLYILTPNSSNGILAFRKDWGLLPEKSQRFREVAVTVVLQDLSTIEATVVSVSFWISTMNAELCNIIIGL